MAKQNLLETNMGKNQYKEFLQLTRAADCKLQEAIKIIRKAQKCFTGGSDSEDAMDENLQGIIKTVEDCRASLLLD